MVSYTLKRAGYAIPVMLIVAFVVFSILYIAPGDPASILAGDQATSAQVAMIRDSLGLDRPFAVRFFEWLWRVVHGDLGTSIYTRAPVAEMIQQRLGPTLSLLSVTFVLSVLIAIPAGILAAAKKGTVFDTIVMGLAVFGFSVPVFVCSYFLAFTFGLKLGWTAVQGFSPISSGIVPFLRTIILPACALSLVYIALIARITRASMLEALSQDYIRTARAKGLGRFAILYIHALKNAGVPIVTVLGFGTASLLSGSVVIENVFAIPGIGSLVTDAILRRDYPVIQGVTIVFSFGFALLNIAIDAIYILIDPRIKY